jgi:hypothetical protein
MPQQRLNGLVRMLALGSIAGSLAGCSQSVLVESEFPTPLVERLPVRMGFIIDPTISNFEHYEEIPQSATWTIQLGDASLSMLQPLFETMFTGLEIVEDVPVSPGTPPLDGVIKPVLERFEFDVPVATRDEFVEVWLQYQIRLYEPDGELIVEWPVTGYGKAELGRANREASVSRAAIIAMREAGAAIATKFAEQPRVSYWLEERQDAAAALSSQRVEYEP